MTETEMMNELQDLKRRVAALEHEARFRLWSLQPEVSVATYELSDETKAALAEIDKHIIMAP